MNGATVKTLVEACGLSRREAAIFLGIDERNVGNWYTGRYAAADAHVQRLTELLEVITETVDDHAEVLESFLENDLPFGVLRYEHAADMLGITIPLGSHHAIVRGVYACAPDLVVVIRFEREQYAGWLGDREDSVEMRQEWCADMLEIEAMTEF